MRVITAAFVASLFIPAVAFADRIPQTGVAIWSGFSDDGHAPGAIDVEELGGVGHAVLEKQLATGTATIVSMSNDNSRFQLEIDVPDLPHDPPATYPKTPRTKMHRSYLSYQNRWIASNGSSWGGAVGGKVRFTLARDAATAVAHELNVPLRERTDLAAGLDFHWKMQPTAAPGGPLLLTLEVKNRGTTAVGFEQVGTQIGRITITGRNDRGGKIHRVEDYRHDRGGTVTYTKLAPGDSMTIVFRLETYIELDEIGDYNIDVKLGAKLVKDAADPWKTHRPEDVWELALGERFSFHIRS